MKLIIKNILIMTLFFNTVPVLWAQEVVNVYSARIEKLIKPAFDAFTKETGIEVKYMTAKEAQLIERLKSEKKHTKADLLLTVDAGNLWIAKNEGLLQPVGSPVLDSQIPPYLKDEDGHWYGLTVRARTIVYSTKRVKANELSSYESLGDPKWKNRLCLRTSKKVYNKSLVATMIKALGKDESRKILEGWMANKPIIHAKDSGVLKGIASGQCDVGVVNTYYLGRELKKNAAFPVALFWANQGDRGTHVNVSGGGITKYAKNRDNALKLLEFLSSAKAQNLFADDNMEYPVNQNVPPSSELRRWWGDQFKHDTVNVASAGYLQADAVRLMAEVKYR